MIHIDYFCDSISVEKVLDVVCLMLFGVMVYYILKQCFSLRFFNLNVLNVFTERQKYTVYILAR